MNEYQISFLRQSVLGQQVHMNSPEDVIKRCIELADKDMLSGGRFICDSFNKKERKDRVDHIMKILKSAEFKYQNIDKKDLCEKIFWECDQPRYKKINNIEREYRPFGLTQKIINMTFKYLYIFKEYIGVDIDFSQCECPLDSIILEKLGCMEKWTNITFNQYEKIKCEINKKLNDEKYTVMKGIIGGLAFDNNWLNDGENA